MKGWQWILWIAILIGVLFAITKTPEKEDLTGREFVFQAIHDMIGYAGNGGYYLCKVTNNIAKGDYVYVWTTKKLVLSLLNDSRTNKTAKYHFSKYLDGIGKYEGRRGTTHEITLYEEGRRESITVPDDYVYVCRIEKAFNHEGKMFGQKSGGRMELEMVWFRAYQLPEQRYVYVDEIPYKDKAVIAAHPIHGTSMSGTIEEGETPVLVAVTPRQIKQGDILFFIAPYWWFETLDIPSMVESMAVKNLLKEMGISEEEVEPGVVFVHRAIYVYHPKDPKTPSLILTKGDANRAPDGWILSNQVVAKVVAAITKDGKIKSFVGVS